ncbi:MAG TPA: two-component regulator propeller domain-containing protein, partial [Pyrinomonadaceae bacterium]|nr:two-component regulator propeller domain-containing protein [Pyrinomonadaceae bacterium]
FTDFGIGQGLPHSTVNDFLETRNGEMWIATNGGLVLFNPRGEPAARVVYANDKAQPVPMFTVVVPEDDDRQARAFTVIYEDRAGTIWCGTMKHLYRLERHDDHFKLLAVDMGTAGEHSTEVYVYDLLEDREGTLWVAAANGLFRRRRDGRIGHYTKRDGLPDDVIHDLLEDHQGRLWAATRLGGFFRFVADDISGSPLVAEVYDKRKGLPTDWVFQLFETSDHRFWIATNVGLVAYFPEGNERDQRFRVYTKRHGLSFQEVTALNEDSGGNLWLGTNTAGAMKLVRDGFVTYGEQDGVNSVGGILADRAGGVCFRGNVLGDKRASIFDGSKVDLLHSGELTYWQTLGRYDGQRFTWFVPDALKRKDFGWVREGLTLQTRNGEWWVAMHGQLYHFPAADNLTQLVKARPLAVYGEESTKAVPQIFRIFEDSLGRIWISSFDAGGNRLAFWEPAKQTLNELTGAASLPSLKDDIARSFAEDPAGNIWIGFNTGLARYRDGTFTFFATKDGLPPGPINYIYTDHAGRLWLALSRSGLLRVDDPATERPAFTSYTTAEGLSSNSVEVITEDLNGDIYAGTGRGLDRLDPATGRIRHYTAADGLASGSFLAALRDRKGNLWFGTHTGLSRFVPSPHQLAAPLPILISGIRVAGLPQPLSALGEGEVALPEFASNQNEIRINFVGLSFTTGDVLRYQYRFEGADADWSAPSEQRTVNLARLSPGRYRFVVRAVNSDGLVSAQPAIVSFTILPPIWQRWWFLMLTLAAVALAVYALYRYRVARLLELERVRTRIASDLHDDIGSNLSLIAGLSEMLNTQVRGSNGQIAERLSIIASVSRRSVDAMSDIVWAVNPKRDNALDLSQRMRRFASDTLAARNIEFHLDAPNVDRNTRVNAEIRREVFLIFKEAINNVARHAACQTAKAHLRIERGAIILTLHDDGRGFKASNGDPGHGLESMRGRAHRLGGELKIDSTDGKGTTLELRIPLNYRSE